MSSISRNCASPLRAARLLADGPNTRAWKRWLAANPDPITDEYLSCGTSTFLGRANSRSDTTTSISTNGRNNRRVEFDLDLILRDESEKSTESIPVRSPVQQSPNCVRQPSFVGKGPVFRYQGKSPSFTQSLHFSPSSRDRRYGICFRCSRQNAMTPASSDTVHRPTSINRAAAFMAFGSLHPCPLLLDTSHQASSLTFHQVHLSLSPIPPPGSDQLSRAPLGPRNLLPIS